ncbi:MAG TPA: hypothetical protein DEF42_04840 [Desulfosporosinus sp.]|nr:hypothetical protein [Desulfosporosinus sp.]
MSDQNREQYQVWAMRLSIGTTLIVVLLSWFNELGLLNIIIRAGVSFGVIYVLMIGSLNLFERTGPQKPQDTELDTSRGSNIDFSVGDDEFSTPQEKDAEFPGQIDRDLSSGLPDSERQAEIVRRMGWQ